MKKMVYLTLLFMMVMVQIAFAGTEKGDKELQIQGSITNTESSDTDSTSNDMTYQIGYNSFYSSNFSFGLTLRESSSKSSSSFGSSKSKQTFISIRVDGYLGEATSKFMPYIGLHIGQATTVSESGGDKHRDSSGSNGIHGGLKVFLDENISWNIEYDRTTYTYEYESGDEIEMNVERLFTGFSYYF